LDEIAIQKGHRHVEHDDLRMEAITELNRLAPIGSFPYDFKAFPFQDGS